jgi:hypothetical protein
VREDEKVKNDGTLKCDNAQYTANPVKRTETRMLIATDGVSGSSESRSASKAEELW